MPTARQRQNGLAIDAFLIAHPPARNNNGHGYTAAELGRCLARSETWVRRNIRWAARAQTERGSRFTMRFYQGSPSGGPTHSDVTVYTLIATKPMGSD